MTKTAKTSIIVVVIIAIALIVWGIFALTTQPKEPDTTNPITIGFVGPLTGGPAIWGEGARNMVELAVEEINQDGGIDGRLVNVIYEDGKCSPADAVSATQKLQRDGVQFIIGGHCSPETVGIVPLTQDGSLFILAGLTSANEAVTDSEFAYRTSPPTRDFTDLLADIAIEKYQKVAAITEQAAFAQSYTKDFLVSFANAGGEIVSDEGYQPGQTDFRTMLTKIKNTDPDALYISPQSPTTASNIIKQMKELDFNVPIFANSIAITSKVYADAGSPELMDGAFSIIPYTDKEASKSRKLSADYKAKFGSEVPYNYFYVSASYDATYMLAEALEKSGEDVQAVANYLKNINYRGVSLDYVFQENGDSVFDSWAKISLDAQGNEIIEPL